MKNEARNPILIIAAVFCAFLLGLLFGRLFPLNSYSLDNSSAQVNSSHTIVPVVTEHTNPALININTASADDLTLLPGIGPTLAERIITYRDTVSKFETINDLLNVKGIGDAILSTISNYITTGG